MPDLYAQRHVTLACVLILLHLGRTRGPLTTTRYTACLAATATLYTAIDLVTGRITPFTALAAAVAVWFTIDARQRHHRTTRLGGMARHL